MVTTQEGRRGARASSAPSGALGRGWAVWREEVWPRALERWWLVSFATSAVAVLACLIASRAGGFPLDDSWIHQDFARTLATTGRFAFQPGRSGAGSTSPLWVLLLAPPQLLTGGQAPVMVLVVWSALLGMCCLAALGVVTGTAARMVARAAQGNETQVAFAGLLAVMVTTTEWHLVWAAASGMETVLFALESLALLLGVARGWRPTVLGLLTAATIATRPEGALAGGLAATFALWLALRSGRDEPNATPDADATGPHVTKRTAATWLRRWALPFALAMACGLVPYAVLNLLATGRVLPSTFYAKAAFYGTGSGAGLLIGYVWQVGVVLVMSSPVLLVLGVLSYSRRLLSRTERRGIPEGGSHSRSGSHARAGWRAEAGTLPGVVLWTWPLLLLTAYAVHLPVAYQHARYEMPALPPLIALASAGATPLLLDGRRRLLAGAGAALMAALTLVSVARAAQIEAANVGYIQAYQVRTALWLRRHTPPGALVASHDVGAIGYFSGRPVVDMAGLIDPQVVPLLGDQRALEQYLAARHVQYVAMFVDWFPPPTLLADDLRAGAVYTARSAAFAGSPDSVFVVYQTRW